MSCEKCQDRGFTEREHGLVMVLCDCEKGKAKRAEITGEALNDDKRSIGIGLPDTAAGSPDTGKPKRTRKPKAKKKARARAG